MRREDDLQREEGAESFAADPSSSRAAGAELRSAAVWIGRREGEGGSSSPRDPPVGGGIPWELRRNAVAIAGEHSGRLETRLRELKTPIVMREADYHHLRRQRDVRKPIALRPSDGEDLTIPIPRSDLRRRLRELRTPMEAPLPRGAHVSAPTGVDGGQRRAFSTILRTLLPQSVCFRKDNCRGSISPSAAASAAVAPAPRPRPPPAIDVPVAGERTGKRSEGRDADTDSDCSWASCQESFSDGDGEVARKIPAEIDGDRGLTGLELESPGRLPGVGSSESDMELCGASMAGDRENAAIARSGEIEIDGLRALQSEAKEESSSVGTTSRRPSVSNDRNCAAPATQNHIDGLSALESPSHSKGSVHSTSSRTSISDDHDGAEVRRAKMEIHGGNGSTPGSDDYGAAQLPSPEMAKNGSIKKRESNSNTDQDSRKVEARPAKVPISKPRVPVPKPAASPDADRRQLSHDITPPALRTAPPNSLKLWAEIVRMGPRAAHTEDRERRSSHSPEAPPPAPAPRAESEAAARASRAAAAGIGAQAAQDHVLAAVVAAPDPVLAALAPRAAPGFATQDSVLMARAPRAAPALAAQNRVLITRAPDRVLVARAPRGPPPGFPALPAPNPALIARAPAAAVAGISAQEAPDGVFEARAPRAAGVVAARAPPDRDAKDQNYGPGVLTWNDLPQVAPFLQNSQSLHCQMQMNYRRSIDM